MALVHLRCPYTNERPSVFREIDGKPVCDHCGRVLVPAIDLPYEVFLDQADVDFDRIAALARLVVKAPTTMVTLVDQEHQVFAGADGLADEDERHQPLAASLCQLVVMSASPLVLGDTANEPLAADACDANPYEIGAYAGFPIFDLDGNSVGTVCALDIHEREWSDEELLALKEFAALATTQLRLRGMAWAVQGALEKMEEHRDSSGKD